MKVKSVIKNLTEQMSTLSEEESMEYLLNLLSNTTSLQNRGVHAIEALAISVNTGKGTIKTKESDVIASEHSALLQKAKRKSDKVHKIILKHGVEIKLLLDCGFGFRRLKKHLKDAHKINLSDSSVKKLIGEMKVLSTGGLDEHE